MTIHKSIRAVIASLVGVTVKVPPAYDIAGSYETVADWSKVYPKPRIVFHKATEGTFYQDPKLASDFAGMAANGIKRGAYHFHRKAYDPTKQAQYFCNYIRGIITPADKLILDVEEGGETPTQIIQWLNVVENTFQNEILIYSTKYLLDAIVAKCTPSELTRLKQYRLWIAGYPLYPDNYSSIPSGYVPANLGDVVAWQYSESGTVDGIVGKVDLDWLSSTFAAELGAASTVEHTQPAPGIDEYTEVVNGVKCHITLMDMAGKKIHVRHFPGGLGYVSQIAPGSLVAFNGIDYNKQVAPPIPYGPAYTAGVAANSLNPEFRYFLNFSPSNDVTFTFKNFTAFYNTTAFVRPLVIDGAIAPDIRDNPNKLEYVEVHACAAFGYCKDGRLIQIAAEGKYPTTGVTVPQLVSLLLKYGAQNAGQHGGGGDMSKAINGKVINSFSDPQERPVAQVIYITGENMVRYEARAISNNTKVRPNHNTLTDFNPVITFDAGALFYGDVLWIADATNKDASQYVGDKWLQIDSTHWVAIVHRGVSICTLKDNGTPPPAVVKIESLTIEPAKGTVFTWLMSDGTTKKETV